MSSECDYCHAEIQWVHSENGAWMPIDWTPMPDGNIVLQRAEGQTVAHVLKKGETPVEGTPRFRAHFVVCTRPRKAKR